MVSRAAQAAGERDGVAERETVPAGVTVEL